MKVAGIVSLLGLGASSLAATTRTLSVSYDTGYDQGSRSLNVVACSDGTNGLETKYGYSTQGQIPTFPRIGGSVDIAGYNSPQCGTCYKVTYKSKSIFILGIDHTDTGLNIAEAALNTLTGGQAVHLGRVNAQVTKVGVSKCGLTPKRDLREIEFNA